MKNLDIEGEVINARFDLVLAGLGLWLGDEPDEIAFAPNGRSASWIYKNKKILRPVEIWSDFDLNFGRYLSAELTETGHTVAHVVFVKRAAK